MSGLLRLRGLPFNATPEQVLQFFAGFELPRGPATQHGQSAPPWQCPSSPPVPPQGAPVGSGQLGTPRGEARPLGSQPRPQVLERAACKVADFTALDHLGGHTHGARAQRAAQR